jgi:peptidyl-dipeptidase A
MLRTAPRAAVLAAAAVLFPPSAWAQVKPASSARAGAPAGGPTAAQARAFVEEAEARLLELSNRQSRADWVSQTYITDDTERISADANQALIAVTMELAKAATRYDKVKLPDDVRRKLTLLELAAIPCPLPPTPSCRRS